MAQAKTATVYYTLDGSAPDGTIGYLLLTTDPPRTLPISPPPKFYSATGAVELIYLK